MRHPVVRDDLRALRGLVRPAGAEPALDAALAELDAEMPSKPRIGLAIETALDAAKERAAFEDVVDAAEPIVQRLVDWLGSDFVHLSNLLRHKQFGRRYPIEVVDYDPAWPERYEQEAALLRARFGGGCLLRTEHFGSTAVPGLASKPVLDLLLQITSFEAAERELRPALEATGYVYFWRSDSPPPHMMFAKGYGPDGYLPGVQLTHLHAAPSAHPLWERLLFRDYLRAHPEVARRYAHLKHELAQRFVHDREAYTRAKADFVHEITELARASTDLR